jgi:TfoX/Sxy family transcriptional regulator of competence genes
MKTTSSQLTFYLDLIQRHLPQVTAKKMFGEYGLYCGTKFFALVCNNQLFLRATDDLQRLIQDDSVRAYSGASNRYFHIPEELIEDEQLLPNVLDARLNFIDPAKKTSKKG